MGENIIFARFERFKVEHVRCTCKIFSAILHPNQKYHENRGGYQYKREMYPVYINTSFDWLKNYIIFYNLCCLRHNKSDDPLRGL